MINISYEKKKKIEKIYMSISNNYLFVHLWGIVETKLKCTEISTKINLFILGIL